MRIFGGAMAFVFCATVVLQISFAQELTLDGLFPDDRVLDVRITVDEEDWDTIRVQTRNIRKELGADRKTAPIEGPYSYVNARITIDGVDLGDIGLRKKGFLGSQSSVRPSLKIKLDHVNEAGGIEGLSSLTLNNNRQDLTVMYQFLGYAFFNAAGSPAPRCAFARVTVNDKDLGVYSHVESAREPLLQRGFGNDQGTLYEGTVVDFFEGWVGSFERKLGNDVAGRQKIKLLIEAMIDREGNSILEPDAKGRAWIPTKEEYDDSWTQLNFDDSMWRKGRGGAGFETQIGFESLIGEGFDFQDELYNESTSLCLRIPFEIEDADQPEVPGNLYLRMKYDDGFVAWLNGHRIASSNAPQTVRWNARATTAHEDSAALQFEWFDISGHKDKLRPGKNLLAIQALNSDKRSTDMLCVADLQVNDYDFEKAISQHVDLDAFYRFWAIEGLLGFWDGYTANRNNFFVYFNPETDRLHFMPWGLDAIFVKYGFLQRDRTEPLCVKTSGRLAHKLYQSKAGRERYAREMRSLLENHWDEESLLAEVDRVEAMIRPYLDSSQQTNMNLRQMKQFIRTRRADIEKELEDGLPVWTRTSGEPPIIPANNDNQADNIWNAAKNGDVEGLKRHVNKGVDVNAIDKNDRTPLSVAALLGHLEALKYLIEEGADINLRSRGNQTVLHLSAFLGHLQVVRFLLEQDKTNLNATNANKQTPLDICTTSWDEVKPVIDFLTDQFDVEFDPKKIQDGRESVAEFLRDNGAKTAKELK